MPGGDERLCDEKNRGGGFACLKMQMIKLQTGVQDWPLHKAS